MVQHLKFWVARQSEAYQLAYWRTRSGLEVDFVVYGPKGLWAIEVKRGAHPSAGDLKGLKAFREDYPEATCILLHTGSRPLQSDGIRCLPVQDFLKEVRPDQALCSPETLTKE